MVPQTDQFMESTQHFFTDPRDVQASSLKLQSMRLLARGRRQDSVYIVAVLRWTSMVEPPAMLDVGLC